jgi:hypothetical protein
MDLGDLGDLMSGTAKPTSPGGPTPQPASAPATTAEAADTTAPTTTAPPEATTNGSAANGSVADGARAATNGAVNPNGTSATIRKRSIEVDGPSASFD